MIPQITEINFPAYATLNNATITLAEMGDRTITTQIKIDGDVVPDFTGWALEFKGERFVLPTKEPQAAKDNSSRRSTVDLTFTSWAVNELKRYFFVEMASVTAGTAIADKYKASLGLSLENFVTAFNNVLDYYFNGQIHMDLFGAGTGMYSQEPSFIEIDYTYIWAVLQKVYEIYDVRWTFAYDNVNQRYLIKVGYPAPEIDDHDFEYGYKGGLLRFERQVQDYNITNILLGRGGENNLPYRYFKKTDPNNPEWQADPDAIPELKNIYFENLRDINFRRYVQGWKTNPNRLLEEGDSVETYDTERAETDWAYAKGHTDEKFNPVEYVKDDDSIALYGEHWGALENNDDIFPTIQGIEISPYGRIDEVVDVEQVTTDDIEAMATDAAEITNVQGATKSEWIEHNSRITVEINGPDFTVPENKTGNLAMVGTWVDTVEYGKHIYTMPIYREETETIPPSSPIRGLVNVDTANSYIVAVSKTDSREYPISGIPAGTYYYKMHIEVRSDFNRGQYDKVNVTVGVNGLKLTTAEGNANAWKPTFDIWVKNIWDTTQQQGESDTQYAQRVWEPILGDSAGDEAAVVFSTGFLSISEDYNFIIASYPVVDRTKTIDGVSSEWRITLIKSDAEYDATGKYIPNSETGGNASAGDFFYFTGIDMPWIYVKWAEERLNAYKETELAKVKQINPTWVVQIDKVRANTKEQGELEYLADRFASGAKLRVRDKRFTNNNILTLYVQTITYTWQQPSSGNPYLVPDIEVVLSDKIVSVESPIDRLEGSVDLIQTSYAKISDIEGAIRRVASPIFLKKTGESEMSLSPTRFSSIVSSESFRQGDIGGQGWGAYVDGEGHTVLEADTVVVRKDMRVNTLTVNQIAYLGGKQIISAAAMECNRVEEVDGGYKCYFDQKQGSVANLFKVDDVVLGQVWNADESELRYYKRKVIAIDSDSITLSSSIADGTGVPHPKDIMVQYGSYSDTSRQYVILRDVIGGGYERMLSGLTSVYTDGTEYYFAGRQDGSTPRWFVGDALGQYASYQNGVLNIAGRLAVTTQIDTGNGTYTALSNYLSNLQDQIDGNVQTWYASGVPTLNNYPANTWPTVEDKNNHIGDLYYDSATGKAYRFMYDGTNEVYLWTQIADEDIAAALALAQQNQTAIAGLQYLKAATNQGTLVQGGLVLTSMIQLGQTEQGVYKVYSGINGIMDSTALGNGIAAWYGGQMADKVADSTLVNYAKSLFRFDGSGYLASGNIKWDLNGNGEIPGISWNNGRITLSSDIYLQGGDRLTALIDAVNRMYSQFAYDSQDHITVAPTHALYIPTTSPEYPIAGKVALYYDYSGFYSEVPTGGGGGDVYDLIYKKNGRTVSTINLGTAEGVINVTVGWDDLTPDANHRFLTDTLISTWNAKYTKPSGGIPKTDLASAVQTSLGKADTALQSYTETDPTVPAWAKAANKPSYTASEVGALPDDTVIPSKTSDLTNDSGFITGYTETDPVFSASAAAGITSANITAWNSKYSKPSGGIPKTDLASDVQTSLGKADTALQSFTETDPTVPSWAKASTKPSYSLSEITGTSDLQAIEALTGTTGLLRKTAANTWELDTATYLVANDHKALTLKVGTATVGSDYTSLAAKTYTITKQNITDAIGSSTYAPYNANGYVPTTRKVNGHALSADVTVTKGDVGLGNVENTALSTWTGSSYITTLGTITTGVWNGTAIANQYLANSSISIEGQSVSLGGSLTNHLVTLGTEQTITGSKKMKSVSLLNVPASAPASADIETGKFYLYATTLGEYSETPGGGGGGGADVHDLTIRKNSTSLGTYNLGEEDADINIPIGWSDLTPDSTHRFVSDAEKAVWNASTQKTQAIPYIVGPDTDATAGTWTGTYDGITAYSEGLTIIYVPNVAGASTTKLNINGLGAVTCYYSGTSKMTTHYPVGTPILLTYRTISGTAGWRRADYDSNTNTYIRIYRQTTGYDGDYPIIVSRTQTIGTAGSNGSYTAVYGVVGDTNIPTINPMTGLLKATTFQGNLAWSYITNKPTLGTAAAKDYADSVSQNGTGLPTSGAVYSAIASAVTSALHYRGMSSTALTDGGTETAVIGGVSLVPQSGDVVIYGGFEFLWENNVWNKLGDDTSYALKTISISAGTGLTGGGDLTASRTISLSQATITSLGKADTAYTRTNVQQGSYLTTDNSGHLQVDVQELERDRGYISSIPIASSSVLGTIKVGDYLMINSTTGVLSVDYQGLEQEVEEYLGLGTAATKDYTTSVSSGSSSLVTSGAVYTAVNAKYTKPSTGIPKTDLASAVQTTLTNADTAYGWGDHSQAGYLTSYTETDPVFSASAASGITSSNISTWNGKYAKPSTGIPKTDLASAVQTTLSNADTAYGWGNHASAGYLTSSSLDGYVNEIATGTGNYISGVSKSGKKLTFTYGTLPTTIAWGSVTGKPTTISGYGITDAKIANGTITLGSNSITPLTSFTETDPVFSASDAAGITAADVSNWDEAYGWGNHAEAGYLTSFTETDPTVPSWAKAASKPTYTLDEVADGSTRKLSNYVSKVTSTDNAVARFNGTAGAIQNSGVLIDDSNNLSLPLGSSSTFSANSKLIIGNAWLGTNTAGALSYGIISGSAYNSYFAFEGTGLRPASSASAGDNKLDIGKSTLRFKDAYFGGTINTAGADISDSLSVPTDAPSSTTSGKIYLYASSLGEYAVEPWYGFNQLVENGDFASTSGWSMPYSGPTRTVANNILTLTCGTSNNYRPQVYHLISVAANHKIYYTYTIKITTSSPASQRNAFLYSSSGSQYIPTTYSSDSAFADWKKVSAIVTTTRAYTRIYIGRMAGSSAPLNQGDTVQIKNVMIIDLTEMFGENIPTVEQFEAMYPEDYYDYTPIGG